MHRRVRGGTNLDSRAVQICPGDASCAVRKLSHRRVCYIHAHWHACWQSLPRAVGCFLLYFFLFSATKGAMPLRVCGFLWCGVVGAQNKQGRSDIGYFDIPVCRYLRDEVR